MKKKVLTTTIATGLMAAGVLTTQNPASAKADTVPTGDNATSTNEVATQKSDAKTIAQDNVNTAQTNLDKAKADTQNASDSLQKAKANETTAQKAVDEQTNKVADTQSNVDKAQADVTTAQNELTTAQENAKNATETNIQAAKDNVATQEQNVATAQDQAKQANDAVTEQANKVADAQSNVDKAQADVTAAQNNVNAAQKTVDDAKAAMDPANVQATVDAANKAEAQVNQDKQDVATAQNNLENAKAADATRQTNIDNAKKAVNTAQANVDFSTKQAQEMKDQLNKYQGIKDAAQKEVDGLNDKLANVNTITISDVEAYKKAFNDWYTGSKRGENWTEEDKNFLNDFMNSNTYKGNEADKNITVDINHLTADQIKELSLFSADLLNQVRNQLGLPKVIVTEGSLKLAKDVTDNYVSDNWDKFDHDVDGISRAAEENGLLSGGNFYEDAIFSSDFSEASTMDDLKSILYTGIVTMIGGSGDEMLHAAGLLGVDFGDDISTGKEQYFSAGTSMFPIKEDQMWITKMGHFFNVSKDYIRDSAKFSTTEVPGTSTEDLVTQLNTAKAKLASATDALNKAKDADTQAQQILAKNKAELATAQDNLTKAQNVPVQTETAQKALTDAQNKLATDTKINVDAQAKKEAALGDEAAKQKVLDQANANLATAQKALTDAQAKQKVAENNLSAEKAKLASLQQVANEKIQDVKTAQVALDDAKNKLAALENAPLLVKAAEDKLAAAQKALDPVENVLVSEKAKLSALKQDLADAQADVTTAQKNYDEKLAIQTKAQTDLDNAKKVLQAIYDREALEAQIAAQEKAREEAEKKAAEEKAQAEKNGYHVYGNKVVDENGNQVSNWTVKNGQIIDNKGKVVSGLTINKAGAIVNKTGQQINSKNVVDNLQANKRTQAPVVQSKVAGKTYVSTVVAPEKAKANALPQTGEKAGKTTLVGAILVGLGSLVGLFGLGRKKEY
ncbi:SEC10/PgrA surface exclusion domain-containing protein (plasmid) [Ligilactobacillus salivarius]|uniref:SEC10/PgrA surface exclusion domain-containing protein n=1 Tax=Ligilactobacillus salivarius TaxID=1624 RepID=UPI00263A52F1|nr:SEC10/PgrA surface exclusion domain-containing protein [Ligilactobacillus salivarius]MDN4849036.1 SEC10/PgrA surface exclusion domain-containing protein [Ligilactobacillus salivarius]